MVDPVSCPPTATLASLARGELGRDAALALRQHTASCEACTRVLEAASTGQGVERLGRYLLLNEVGRGAMGRVFRAFDPQLERTVALKVLRDQATGKVDQLLQEARALARLTHPHLVTVYDAGEDGGRVYLAMEYVEGGQTLADWLERAARPLDQVLRLFIQAGRGLEAVHHAGLVLRDFKPSNVLVREDTAKLADFGLALSSETMASDSAGTARYMAPEQRRGQVNAASDQYAFAVSLEEAVKPFGRAASWLTPILERARHPTPEQRFATLGELLSELEDDPAKRLRRRALWMGAPTAAIALVVVSWSAATRRAASCDGITLPSWTEHRADLSTKAAKLLPERSAAETVRKVQTWVDTWGRVATQSCRATRVEHTQSDELFTLKGLCLSRVRARFDAVVSGLTDESVDAPTMLSVLSGLPPVEPCEDPDALLELRRESPSERVRAQPVREQLERAIALSDLGRDVVAEGLVEAANAVAVDGGLSAAHAETMLFLGQVQQQRGDVARSRQTLAEAYTLALATGHEEILARSSADLMVSWSAVPDAVNAMKPFVGAAYARLANVPLFQGRWWYVQGRVAYTQGDYRTARDAFRKAVEVREKAFGADSPQTQLARTNYGVSLERLNEGVEAVKVYADVLAHNERMYGPDSVVALRSRVTWAAGLAVIHQDAEAERVLSELWPKIHALGDIERDNAFTVLDNLGTVRERRGDWEHAEPQRRELVELARGDDFLVAVARGEWALCLLNLGHTQRAVEEAKASLTYFEGVSRTHQLLGLPLLVLARGETDPAKAQALLDRASALELDEDTRKLVGGERQRRGLKPLADGGVP